jgi:chromosome segregation ATPase
MIELLREEGEKLSKKQFDLSQIVKKLRAKEKEMENSIKGLKGEVAGKNLENERLMKSFVTKEGVEQNQKESINKLNADKRTLELKIEQMRSELEDSKENCASMKISVEEASM